MKEILVNLKRFDVPKSLGGICTQDDPQAWIETIISASAELGLGNLPGINLTYFLPEGLLLPAVAKLNECDPESTQRLSIGSQGVFREDVQPGGNFGAFTTNLPAAAAKTFGCTWSIVGHSEERKDKFGMLSRFEPGIADSPELLKRANDTVSEMLNEATLCALKAGFNVCACVGETAEERGEGSFDEQKPRIEAVLRGQLEIGFKDTADYYPKQNIVIGYEPRWAIGPGRTPPGADYIAFVSAFIKEQMQELYGYAPPVVYGGGLKEDNAEMIASIDTIDGGLVALTRFTGNIGFYADELKAIIEKYLG